MIETDSVANLEAAIAECIRLDERVLTSLREEVWPLKSAARRIQPRATTSISLVGTDGGNNQLQFDRLGTPQHQSLESALVEP